MISLPAKGQEIRVGGEFQINSYTIGYQFFPAVAVDGDGDFVVVWFDEQSNFQLAARRFSSAGTALASEFQVNSVALNLFSSAHSAASRADGDFVVVWSRPESSGYGVFARLFSSAGSPQTGELQVNASTIVSSPFSPALPVVASDAAGDFVVTWHGQGAGGYDNVRARRFSSAGTALTDELQVNTYTPVWRSFPVVASDAHGDFVVAWKRLASTGFPAYYHIAARRFTSAGVASSDEFQVNTQTIHYLAEPFPAVASDAVGDFVVAWKSLTAGEYAVAVLGRRFSITAVPLTGVFQVNAYTTTAGNNPWVTALPEGDFIVTWNGFVDGSETGILARRFTSAGTPFGVELQVNTYTPDSQSIFRSVAANAAGQFIVTWSSQGQDGSDSGVFGQRSALPTLTPTPTFTATATPTFTPTSTSPPTSIAPAGLYAIPTLSRAALAVFVLLVLAASLGLLLVRRTH